MNKRGSKNSSIIKFIAPLAFFIYWSNDDQAFIAEVPELPGCMAHGKSPDEALANCKDAMDL